jgi:hypothetical protein
MTFDDDSVLRDLGEGFANKNDDEYEKARGEQQFN